jgi:hypothetical protein
MMMKCIVVNGKNIRYDDFYRDNGEETMKDDDWAERAKGLLKAELKRRGLGYRDLAERLTAAGNPENERNLANKISRGGFTAAFLLQCLAVIGCHSVRLDDLQPLESH